MVTSLAEAVVRVHQCMPSITEDLAKKIGGVRTTLAKGDYKWSFPDDSGVWVPGPYWAQHGEWQVTMGPQRWMCPMCGRTLELDEDPSEHYCKEENIIKRKPHDDT